MASGGARQLDAARRHRWNTFEVQAAYRPSEGDFTDGRHALTLGAHRNAYLLDSLTSNASDWRSTETTLAQRLPRPHRGDGAVCAGRLAAALKT